MISHLSKIKNKFNLRYALVVLLLVLLTIAVILVTFSINTDGNLLFLIALDKQNNIQAYLTIGLGCIASILVAIALNIGGEAVQSTMRNPLASPFTLGLTSSMTLAYCLSDFFNANQIYYVAILSFVIMFLLNILPTYLLASSKYKRNDNVFILYGLSITILLNSCIGLISYMTKTQDYNIFGWMVTSFVTFSDDKFIVGSICFLIGFIIFLTIIKKVHIVENNYFKASTLGVNIALIRMISLISISLMVIGGFVIYAPFTLLGFGIPFITKTYLIKQYDIRTSLLPSTLLSVLVTLLSYIMHIYSHLDINVVIILIMMPLIVFMMCKKEKYIA